MADKQEGKGDGCTLLADPPYQSSVYLLQRTSSFKYPKQG